MEKRRGVSNEHIVLTSIDASYSLFNRARKLKRKETTARNIRRLSASAFIEGRSIRSGMLPHKRFLHSFCLQILILIILREHRLTSLGWIEHW